MSTYQSYPYDVKTYEKDMHQSKEALEKIASGFTAKVGLVLGSGLGKLAEEVENPIRVSYEDLPGFPKSTIKGHKGVLVLGDLFGVPVVCLQGRVHLYEGVASHKIKVLIRALKHLGCHTVILTNAVGSLRKEVKPGELSLISDHINFQYTNPMIGPNDEEYGERFFALNEAYNKTLRQQLKEAAKAADIKLTEGIYVAVTGPCFETPAEIRAYRILGADLVGMSTAPEVIVARHCQLKVAAISAVVNLAAGMAETKPAHEETLKYGAVCGEKLFVLIKKFFEMHGAELKK